MLFQPQVVEERIDSANGTVKAEPKLIRQGEVQYFDAPVGVTHGAALKMMAYAMTWFLHQDPQIAVKQAQHLNAALAQLEFQVETDAEGHAVLNCRVKEEASVAETFDAIKSFSGA